MRYNRRVKVYLDNCCYNRPFDDQSLGVVGATRFLQQYDTGYGDYTKEKYAVPEEDAQTVYEQLKKY